MTHAELSYVKLNIFPRTVRDYNRNMNISREIFIIDNVSIIIVIRLRWVDLYKFCTSSSCRCLVICSFIFIIDEERQY